ncbi:MAG: hypothetical protein C5B49_04885 [Bdellovibrio sp.]|nr:MAG: hypothetical protein C5B49_04885 [Bdellovibrio sp.]
MNESELQQIFPQTLASLRREKLDLILNEFQRFCVNDLDDNKSVSGWFPVFLKAHGLSSELTEICYWEWLRFSCCSIDWGEPRMDPGQVRLAPGVQVMKIQDAAKKLAVDPGPHVIYQRGAKVQSRVVNAPEALLLDVLQEERKFSETQLVDYLKMEAEPFVNLRQADWRAVVGRLKDEGILIVKSALI